MSLLEHLDEFRARLVRSLAYVALGAVIGFLLYDRLIDLLLEPWCDAILELAEEGRTGVSVEQAESCTLALFAPAEGFALKIKTAIYTGIVIAMPLIVWEVWRFVSPGLTVRERRWARPVVPAVFLFFLFGLTLGYLALPRTMQFLIGFSGANFEFLLRATDYLSFALFFLLAFGITFQFPLVLLLLEATVVTWRQLLGTWRYVIVGVTVFAAIVTPSQDPITLMFMVLPMVVFYFAAIALGYFLFSDSRREKRRAKAAAETGQAG